MLAYLSRYTHRVAISNSRLLALDDAGVTFKWKDYRIKGRDRLKTMTLEAAEFIRRFLLHVLPSGFHRIRHYGLFAGTVRARNIARARQLLAAAQGLAPKRARQGRQRDRNAFACAPMPVLRRPDDRHRDVRRPRPARSPPPIPDQDRHLMIVAALPASHTLDRLHLPRAPEQEADVLTRSPVLHRPLRARQARASPRPNTPALVGPAGKTAPTPPAPATNASRPQS